MQHFQWQLRGIPLWLVSEYLCELGGQAGIEQNKISGPGWEARLEQLEDFQVGALRVGQVALEITALKEVCDQLIPALEQKLLRAGG